MTAPVSPATVNALIVYAHPEPSSFCAAMKDTAVETLRGMGAAVQVSDLYAEAFNPVAGRHDFLEPADAVRFHYQHEQLSAASHRRFAPDIAREQARVAEADLFLFVFPLWWGGVPAILKGWFDRVLAYGFAYADGKRYEEGYFHGCRGMLGISTGGTAHRFTAGGSYGEMGQVLHGVQHCMLEYLGLESHEPFVAYAAPRVTGDERAAYLAGWAQRIQTLCADETWVASLAQRRMSSPLRTAPTPGAAGGWTNRT